MKLVERVIGKQIPNHYCQYTIQWEFSNIGVNVMLRSHCLYVMSCTNPMRFCMR